MKDEAISSLNATLLPLPSTIVESEAIGGSFDNDNGSELPTKFEDELRKLAAQLRPFTLAIQDLADEVERKNDLEQQ